MGRAPTGRPTSFDIAYLAGVSQPTVSRAPAWRQVGQRSHPRADRKIASELNYTVDKNASSLRSQRSNTIALLFFEDPTPDESMINPFFLAMLGSITRACANHGLDLLISFQRMEDDWHVRYQDSHRADGLILLGYGDYTLYRERLEQLARQGTAFRALGFGQRRYFGQHHRFGQFRRRAAGGRTPAGARTAAARLPRPCGRSLSRIRRSAIAVCAGRWNMLESHRKVRCSAMRSPPKKRATPPPAA